VWLDLLRATRLWHVLGSRLSALFPPSPLPPFLMVYRRFERRWSMSFSLPPRFFLFLFLSLSLRRWVRKNKRRAANPDALLASAPFTSRALRPPLSLPFWGSHDSTSNRSFFFFARDGWDGEDLDCTVSHVQRSPPFSSPFWSCDQKIYT